VTKVPNIALRFKPEQPEDNALAPPVYDGHGVWILRNGTPQRIPATIGISDGNFTEITPDGLKEGQEILVDISQKAKKSEYGHRMF
jgi:hypothetical protein